MRIACIYFLSMTVFFAGVGQWVGHLDTERCMRLTGFSYDKCRALYG